MEGSNTSKKEAETHFHPLVAMSRRVISLSCNFDINNVAYTHTAISHLGYSRNAGCVKRKKKLPVNQSG